MPARVEEERSLEARDRCFRCLPFSKGKLQYSAAYLHDLHTEGHSGNSDAPCPCFIAARAGSRTSAHAELVWPCRPNWRCLRLGGAYGFDGQHSCSYLFPIQLSLGPRPDYHPCVLRGPHRGDLGPASRISIPVLAPGIAACSSARSRQFRRILSPRQDSLGMNDAEPPSRAGHPCSRKLRVASGSDRSAGSRGGARGFL